MQNHLLALYQSRGAGLQWCAIDTANYLNHKRLRAPDPLPDGPANSRQLLSNSVVVGCSSLDATAMMRPWRAATASAQGYRELPVQTCPLQSARSAFGAACRKCCAI